VQAQPPNRLPSGQLTALAAAALDGAADLIGFLDIEGKVLYANRAACDEVQVPRELVIQATIFDFLPSASPETWGAQWQEFRKGGRMRFVDRMRRRDGTLFPVDVQASLVEYDGVEVALVVARDITERRRAELALQESEEAFRALAENNPAFIARFGRDLRFLYVNPAGAGFRGRLPEDVLGMRPSELLWDVPDAAAFVEETVGQVLRTGEPLHSRFSLHRRELDWRVTPELSERGDVVSVLGIATDITEVSLLERELRESRDFIAQVIASAEEGIVVIDRDLRYVLRNEYMEQLTGIPSSSLLGESIAERDVTQLDEVIRAAARALAGHTVHGRDKKLLVGPGMPERWIQATYSPLRDAAGAVNGVILVIHDVTERRRIEQEQRAIEARLLEAQKLESLGVLAGGVAHDFNNLLVGILGNASLALGEPGVTDVVRERLAEIELAARRAADLTRQMLTYAGKGRASVVPVDVSALVTETIDLVRAAIHRSVRLETALGEGLPPVTADRVQLQQVVMNLAINAGEAVGGDGGVVRLTSRALELDAAGAALPSVGGEVAPGRYIEIEVVDSGIGMDAETVARIFDPFFSTKGTGRGLGLSSVLGIVRGHRGTLRVESVTGEGTTFRVLLPVSPGAVGPVVPAPEAVPAVVGGAPAGAATAGTASASAAASAGAATSGGAAGHQPQRAVLLVEDEELVARTVERMLAASGYAVVTASDGAAAMDIFRADPAAFAAVVLDLSMPGLGGEATYRQLRALASELPVLVTSGYVEGDGGGEVPDPADRHAAFLAKPYAPAALADTLARLLGS
jgi:two-component system cell cycle sensor histidine kinase/response regulator CckA